MVGFILDFCIEYVCQGSFLSVLSFLCTPMWLAIQKRMILLLKSVHF